jgi:hypothetical protein
MYFALIVGNDGCSPDWEAPCGPRVGDSELVKLLHALKASGYPKGNVLFVPKTTRAEVENALTVFASRLASAAGYHVLFVYAGRRVKGAWGEDLIAPGHGPGDADTSSLQGTSLFVLTSAWESGG